MPTTPGFFNYCLLWVALTFTLSTPGLAPAADTLVPSAIAHRAGLKVQWDSQLNVGGSSRMVDWCLQVNENESTTYFALESGPLREVVSNRQLNPQGQPFGIEGAKEEINFRAEILESRYKARGVEDFEIKQSSYSLPKSVLYTLSSHGVISALDADTGVQGWERNLTSSSNFVGIGASNAHVAVAVTSKIYCFNASDGRLLWERATSYAVGGSPAVSDSHVFVPLGNGRLQAFEITSKGMASDSFFASGFASAQPLVTPTGVAWATESGQINFANPKFSNAVSFRLRASAGIVSSPTGKGNLVYAATLDGYVYAIDRVQGRLVWEITTGAGISTSPLPIGDSLFVVSNAKQLFKLDAQTGVYAKGWETPIAGVTRLLGTTHKSVFALDTFNRLIVIDHQTGQTTSTIPAGQFDRVLTNTQSDRIYVASAHGMIQCVRDIDNPRPIFHASDFSTSEIAGPRKKSGRSKKNPNKKSSDSSNPFASANDSSADTDNPFAAQDDSADANMEDTETDPFQNFGNAEDDDDNPFN